MWLLLLKMFELLAGLVVFVQIVHTRLFSAFAVMGEDNAFPLFTIPAYGLRGGCYIARNIVPFSIYACICHFLILAFFFTDIFETFHRFQFIQQSGSDKVRNSHKSGMIASTCQNIRHVCGLGNGLYVLLWVRNPA